MSPCLLESGQKTHALYQLPAGEAAAVIICDYHPGGLEAAAPTTSQDARAEAEAEAEAKASFSCLVVIPSHLCRSSLIFSIISWAASLGLSSPPEESSCKIGRPIATFKKQFEWVEFGIEMEVADWSRGELYAYICVYIL